MIQHGNYIIRLIIIRTLLQNWQGGDIHAPRFNAPLYLVNLLNVVKIQSFTPSFLEIAFYPNGTTNFFAAQLFAAQLM